MNLPSDAARAWPFWSWVNHNLSEVLLRSDKPILEAGVGRHRLFPGSITVDLDPRSDADVRADLFHLPWPEKYFGLVVAHEVFCRYNRERQLALLAEFRRVADSVYVRQSRICGFRWFRERRCGLKL